MWEGKGRVEAIVDGSVDGPGREGEPCSSSRYEMICWILKVPSSELCNWLGFPRSNSRTMTYLQMELEGMEIGCEKK